MRMTLDMYQKIRLHNGKTGHVIEIFNNGEAYMVDIQTGDGEYDQVTVRPDDIKSIVLEVDKPFKVAV
jgi:ribosomal protein L21E